MAESEEIRQRRIAGQRERRRYEARQGPAYEAAVRAQEKADDTEARQILESRGLKGKELEEAVKEARSKRANRKR